MIQFQLPDASLRRDYQLVTPLSATHVNVNGRILRHFSSTSYLAMNWNLEVQEYFREQMQYFDFSKLCSFGSNYLGGCHTSKLSLEEKVSEYCGYDAGMAFSSGWMANYSICEFAGRHHELILSDCRNHNSIIEGLANFRKQVKVVDLNQTTAEELKGLCQGRSAAIIYPSVHGITGIRVRPAIDEELRGMCTLICDEAHSFGLLGDHGLAQPNGDNPHIRILGFSKAMGHTGSVVCTTSAIHAALMQYSSTYIYSTPLPPYIYDVNSLLFECMMRMRSERISIFNNATYFRTQLGSLNIPYSGDMHITGVDIPQHFSASQLESDLANLGIYIKVSKFPSVSMGRMTVRFSFNPFHTINDIDNLINAIQFVLNAKLQHADL